MCAIRTISGVRFFSESKESELYKDGLNELSGSPRSALSHEAILLLLNDELFNTKKVEDIKINYKQCQDVLDCAEKRLQTNGLGVTTEDLVATAKNVYTGMITAGSKANQTHKMVEDLKYRVLSHQNNSNDV